MAMAILLACAALAVSLSEPVRAVHASSGHTPPSSSPDEGWIFPGEYESHQAMWMLWPTYENKAGLPSTEVISDLIAAMSGHVHVNLAVQDRADEAAAREYLMTRGVPLDHLHFFRIPHLDIWARDMGPQFTRSRAGQLRVNDWNFNFWGYEEPDSFNSTFDEPFDRRVARLIEVPLLDAARGPTGVRFVHEGGSVSHNGHGTMIAVESVVMQRNLGPDRFCGGEAPVTDFRQPNTYAPNPDWPACRVLVEREFRRMLGVRKIIWIPTGVIEDTGAFRGALGAHLRVPEFQGMPIPHAGVYTMFGVNGHTDEFLRFVDSDTVVLARAAPSPGVPRTAVERLAEWLDRENQSRLERAFAILSSETTESGRPIRVVRIPTPVLTFDVTGPGDGTYEYFAAYDRWEDGSVTPPVMLGLWASSYVNYVPTNDLVIVSKFWKPGRSLQIKARDDEAVAVIGRLFPGREVVQAYSENVNRGGGGFNCITQQQPASAGFAAACGWEKVGVASGTTALYASPVGDVEIGRVSRLNRLGQDIYLERLASSGTRVQVRVTGPSPLDGEIGWVDTAAIESAGEKCMSVYVRD
jgi:agmatine deiminase